MWAEPRVNQPSGSASWEPGRLRCKAIAPPASGRVEVHRWTAGFRLCALAVAAGAGLPITPHCLPIAVPARSPECTLSTHMMFWLRDDLQRESDARMEGCLELAALSDRPETDLVDIRIRFAAFNNPEIDRIPCEPRRGRQTAWARGLRLRPRRDDRSAMTDRQARFNCISARAGSFVQASVVRGDRASCLPVPLGDRFGSVARRDSWAPSRISLRMAASVSQTASGQQLTLVPAARPNLHPTEGARTQVFTGSALEIRHSAVRSG